MSENWRSYPIRELAANSPQSFTDGDWIEAPHIRETGIRLIQTGNIGIGSFIDRSRKYISQLSFDALHCKEIRPGDLLICRLAEPIGRACFAPDLGERMITSVDVTILRVDTESFDPRFVSFCINTPECLRQCEAVSGGTTRQRISRTNLGKVEIRAPSVGAQRRIAEILSTLDDAIEQAEALIAKHQQIKAGLMHDLFTRGVTPDGHLRPTRVQAPDIYKESPLGWIPREWEARLIVNAVSQKPNAIVDGPFGSNLKTVHYRASGIPVIQSGYVTSGIFQADEYYYVTESHFQSQIRSRVNPGDIVMAKIGAQAGMCAVLPEDHSFGILAGNSLKITADNSILQRDWLLAYLHRLYAVTGMRDIRTETAQPAISIGRLKKLLVPVPTENEQASGVKIISALNQSTTDQLASLVKLRQQKLGLIHDLLTGRVRVKPTETEPVHA